MRLSAGAVLALVALHGCATTRAHRTVDTLAGPHFAFGTSDLTPQGRAKVRTIASAINQHPDRRVLVNGFTDSIGSEEYNWRLSERRANTVRECLVQDGVDARRITAQAYGNSNPIASNATAEGRAHNRRVEIILEPSARRSSRAARGH